MGKILKVKDIAKQYGVPAKSVIEELAGQGIEANDAENSVIPDDMIELVEMYFADLYDQDSEPAAAADKKPAKKGGKKPPAGRREEHGGDRGKGSPHKGGGRSRPQFLPHVPRAGRSRCLRRSSSRRWPKRSARSRMNSSPTSSSSANSPASISRSARRTRGSSAPPTATSSKSAPRRNRLRRRRPPPSRSRRTTRPT